MSDNDFKVAAIKPEITLADLEKVDVRVGTIAAVEEVAGSDKLVKLIVNFGDRQRIILSGIKQERENPNEIAGKQALFVVNLPPRKMRGQMSEGMLFDVGFADGIRPCLAVPEELMPDGARAG
jgi:tRNA-binding protein